MPIPWKRNLSGASLTAQNSAENPAKKGKFKELARRLKKFKNVEPKSARPSQLPESFDPSSSHMDWETSRYSSESSEDYHYKPEVRNGSPSARSPPSLQYPFPEASVQYQQEVSTPLPNSQSHLLRARQNDFRQGIHGPFWRDDPTLMDARLECTESLSLELSGDQLPATENEPPRSQPPSYIQVPITYNDAAPLPANFRLSTTSNRSRDSILGPSSTNCSELDVTKVKGLSKELSDFDAPFEEDDQQRSVTLKAQLEKLDDLVEVVEPALLKVAESTKQRRRRSLLSEGLAAARSQEFAGSIALLGPISPPRGFLSGLGHLKEEERATGADVIIGSAEVAAKDSTHSLKCPSCSSSFPGMNRLKQHVKRKHLEPFQCPICQIRHDSSEMRRHYTNQHGFLKGTLEYETLQEQTKDRLAWYKNRLISPKGSDYEVICRILQAACVEQLRAMPEFSDLKPQLKGMPEFTEVAPPLATALRESTLPILHSDLNAPEGGSRVLSPQKLGTTTGTSAALLDANAEIDGVSIDVQVGLQIPDLTKVVEELANDIRENLRMCSTTVQREEAGRKYFSQLQQLVMPLVDFDIMFQDPDRLLNTMTCDPDDLQHDHADAQVAFATESPGAPMGGLTGPSPPPRQSSQPIRIPQPRNSLPSAMSSPPRKQSPRDANFQSPSTSFNSTLMSDVWDNYPEVPTTLATSFDNKTKLVPEFKRKPVESARPVVPSGKDEILSEPETSDSQGGFLDDVSSMGEQDDCTYIMRNACKLFDSDY